MIHLYLIAVDADARLDGTTVVDNYLRSALKNFDKYNLKENNFSYFEGLGYKPNFSVLNIEVKRDKEGHTLKEETIIESVKRIKTINDFMDKVISQPIKIPPY